MEPWELRDDLEKKGTFRFSRSGGPGGQNVNKVNSRVQLSFRLENLECLTGDERVRLERRLEHRISRSGEILISCDQTRDQFRNRELALDKAVGLLSEANFRHKPRKKTRPSQASKMRSRQRKERKSEIKSLRRSPDAGE